MPHQAILDALNQARRDLLDLSLRNRLLNVPRRAGQSRSVIISGESSDSVFRMLHRERRRMSFLPGSDPDTEFNGFTQRDENEPYLLPPSEDESVGNGDVAPRHSDNKLQTRLTPQGLQRRLLSISRDARTLEEEQGVNILFLALGFLNWLESDSATEKRVAPLVLLPVDLDRENSRSQFKLSARDEDLNVNLSLQEKLLADFGIRLPELPETDDWLPADYFADVKRAIESESRWSIDQDGIVLGFFSFSKLLMYRDLKPESWPTSEALISHPLIDKLLGGGFGNAAAIPDESSIDVDAIIDPADMVHILDADSSQTIAINDVRNGHNLVVQGPPGTGKSQTIANMIASAVHQGKTVLFVAEKMAALEVVHERLSRQGLGDLCLELHSRHANKKSVLTELGRTLAADSPVAPSTVEINRLRGARDWLNGQARKMHKGIGSAGTTPYQAVGRLVGLAAQGISPPDFLLRDAMSLTSLQIEQIESGISDLASRIGTAGIPAQHPWRGVRARTVLPSDLQRLRSDLAELPRNLDLLIAQCASTSMILNSGRPADTLKDALISVGALSLLARAPAQATSRIGDPIWRNELQQVEALVGVGNEFAAIRTEVEGQARAEIWSISMSTIRHEIAVNGVSWIRFLKGSYRAALANFRSLMNKEIPKGRADRLALVDRIIEGQSRRHDLEQRDNIGRVAFGSDWRGSDSNFATLTDTARWMREATDAGLANLGAVVAGGMDRSRVEAQARNLAAAIKVTAETVDRIVNSIALDLKEAFEVDSIGSVRLSELHSRALTWRNEEERIHEWIAVANRIAAIKATAAAAIADRLYDGRLGRERARDIFRYAFAEAIWRAATQSDPALAELDGVSREQVIREFRDLDRRRIELAIQETARRHFDAIPRGGAGELGVVREELNKKRRRLPIRKLMERAGSAVQRIKPVFLMSPLSVAQFLPAGRLFFDVLLIDEASQVQPVDALGAVARSRQMVVVGDQKQLPPTNFFRRIVSDDDVPDDEYAHTAAGDMESILSLCAARGVPHRMLRWHYRSRHPSLIAVSNREFYDNKLHLPPSPDESGEEIGLRLNKVERGGYDRGGTARNMTEARRVADAVLTHARSYPDLSLGVGAFSVNQRDAVLDALEERRDEMADLNDFFSVDRKERFFVKNLENIQGDERDIIFLSIGYGHDSSGYMSMNFGPVSADGGERRLNVLISRARRRCEVFSTITADDIDLARSRSSGVAVLKTFLAYAENGKLETGRPTNRDFGSDFEEAVARALQGLGYDIKPQIGVAGFFIDLAVVDPKRPGRYVLGIECDGATYHSARSARDRDRLRQEVLELQGWRIHRIWSTDWYKRPTQELRRAVDAIEVALAVVPDRQNSPSGTSGPHPATMVERELAVEVDEVIRADPYIEASFSAPNGLPPHETPASVISDVIRRIVEIEGPVHEEEVGRRVARLWGLQRAGARIQKATKAGLELAERKGFLKHDGAFWSPRGKSKPLPRDRSNVTAPELRKPEMLPPQEIYSAVSMVVGYHLGIDRETVSVEVGRLLGFGSTSRQLRDIIELQIERLIEEGSFVERDRRIYASG
jgi:very-short-patch-repair endonuclease